MDPSKGIKPFKPCNSCKKRKSRCVLMTEEANKCVLCQFHSYDCIFEETGPPKKKSGPPESKKRKINEESAVSKITAVNRNVNDSIEQSSSVDGADNDSILDKASLDRQFSFFAEISPRDFVLDTKTDHLGNDLIQARSSPKIVSLPDYDCLEESSLHKTLGLQCNRYLSFVGQSSEFDSLLMSYYSYNSLGTAKFKSSPTPEGPSTNSLTKSIQTIRQIRGIPGSTEFRGECLAFMLVENQQLDNYEDESARVGTVQLSPETVAELKQVQELIGSFGPKLMDLFLRNIFPCYPMVHKITLLDKFNRSDFELQPSILAALYSLSLNWWTYDQEISSRMPPSKATLEKLGRAFIAREVTSPTISTIQSGLLLLQGQLLQDGIESRLFSSNLFSQIYMASLEIGLNLNPQEWDIPSWEKSLRKRLAWSVFMQDKWSSLVSGRPSLIKDSEWVVDDVNISTDFSDMFASDNLGGPSQTSISPLSGISLFVEMIELSKILSEILSVLYSAARQSHKMSVSESTPLKEAIMDELDAVKGFQLRLRSWYKQLPSILLMDSFRRGELCANCNLHLCFYAVEITLFRPLLKLLSRAPCKELDEVKQYVFKASFDLFSSAVDLISNLRPQHLQTFWFSFTKSNLALVATFGFLLFITANDLQLKKRCLENLHDYRWSLTLNSKAAPFMKYAIFWIDHYNHKLQSQIEEVEARCSSLVT